MSIRFRSRLYRSSTASCAVGSSRHRPPAHAHGGIAGPDELGPPVIISTLLGIVCYWAVVLWPSRRNRNVHRIDRAGTSRRQISSSHAGSASRPLSCTPALRMEELRNANAACGGTFVCSRPHIIMPQSAFAHGEAADEPFLKDLTVAFYDVHVTPTAVKVGEPVT